MGEIIRFLTEFRYWPPVLRAIQLEPSFWCFAQYLSPQGISTYLVLWEFFIRSWELDEWRPSHLNTCFKGKYRVCFLYLQPTSGIWLPKFLLHVEYWFLSSAKATWKPKVYCRSVNCNLKIKIESTWNFKSDHENTGV